MPHRKKRPYPVPGFGESLRSARQKLGLTQEQVADALGTRKQVVYLWESERSFPQDENLIELCAFLDLEAPLPARNEAGRKAVRQSKCACGKTFDVFYGERYCSRKCAEAGRSRSMRGKNLKSGRTIDSSGYVHVWLPDHPNATNGYVREHRFVMEKKLGRYLEANETVHHKNGNRADNRSRNLELRVGAHGRGATHKHCSTCTCFK